MESDNIWDLRFFSCQHCQRWNECVAALAMNEIPCAIFDTRKYLRGDAVITLRGPGPDANDAHALNLFLLGRGVAEVYGTVVRIETLIPLLARRRPTS